MHTPRFTRPFDIACPDIEAVELLAIDFDLFQLLLRPLPIYCLILFDKFRDLGMFLVIPNKQARFHKITVLST